MRAAPSRTIAWLVLVAAGLGPALFVGCSSAGRIASRGPSRPPGVAGPLKEGPDPSRWSASATGQRTTPFDLMPVQATGKSAAHATPGQGLEATGPLLRSPDGKWIAFESDRDGVHGVWIADSGGERARRVSGNRLAALLPRWSPDSTRLTFLARPCGKGAPCRGAVDDASAAWGIWVADPVTALAHRLPSVSDVPLAGASWFPDSRHVCYGSRNWLVVVDTETNATREFRLPDESGRIIGVPAASPDGGLVAFAVEGDGAWMVSLDTGEVTQIVTESTVDAFAWAPGGRQIAFRDARDGQWKVRMLK